MADKYFKSFKRITYNGQTAVDITARPRLLSRVQHNPFLFYSYELKDNERPDQIADRYYKDPYMAWLVYLSNQVTDPYYGWLMSYEEFAEHIRQKYGSIETAQQKIKCYKNNWEGTDDITVERYNALTVDELKYYDPVYGARGTIVSYTRKQIDWELNTNRIVRYEVSDDASSAITDELVTINLAANTTGSGQVIFSNSSVIDLRHVSGVYLANSDVGISISANSVLETAESELTLTVTAASVQAASITDAEDVYWDPIYFYDYEEALNSSKRSIRLLDSKYARQTANELKTLL